MFRGDFVGTYSFYNVAVLESNSRWVLLDAHTILVPQELRYQRGEGQRRTTLEPWRGLTASGEIWQKYGSHGWATIKPANTALAQLKEHNPELEFSVVKTTLSRNVEIVVPEVFDTGC